jgi:hypothetical protein
MRGICDIVWLWRATSDRRPDVGERALRQDRYLESGRAWALKFPPPQKITLPAVVKGTCWLDDPRRVIGVDAVNHGCF